MNPPLLLATESRYKIALLKRLHIPFISQPAEIDETPLHGETPEALATRLAVSKINTLEARFHEYLILATDQTAALGTQILHKPGSETQRWINSNNYPDRPLNFSRAQRCDGQMLRLKHTSIG